MNKKETLSKALENAKTKLELCKAQYENAMNAVLADNSRANRKSVNRANADVIRAMAHVANLSGELAVADAPKTYEYPNKTKTVNTPAEKKEERKEKRHPAMAKPVSGEGKPENKDWEADKAARKAKRKAKPVFVKKVLPNEGMADATEEYLLAVAWEEYVNGNENAIMVIRELQPKETVTPADVEPEEFHNEWKKIHKLEKEMNSIQREWSRLENNWRRVNEKLEAAKKHLVVRKGLATKAKKCYIASDGDADLYAKMMERRRNVVVAEGQVAAYKKEADKWLRDMDSFADYWAAAEERIPKMIDSAYEKLETAKLAKRHADRQADLEEAFAQRYERGEWVPENEGAVRYRMYAVKPHALFGDDIMKSVQVMKDLVMNKPQYWKSIGKAEFNKLFDVVKNITSPFVVNAKDCLVNNIAASQMSDIMDVEYGEQKPTDKMISVTYDIVGTFSIYWKFIANTYSEAKARVRLLQEMLVKAMLTYGINLVDGDKSWQYYLLASNNSQQKKGQGIMGEAKTMAITEEFREFGWTLDDAIARRPDNAAEWLKRNATLTTPSRVIKSKDEEVVRMKDILMVDDVEIERLFDRVTTVDGTLISKAKAKKLKLTMFDGQAQWLVKGMPSTQMRGAAIKAMAIAMPNYKLPEFATDIMGNRVRVADYKILMTKSCWKAAKMGMNWYEFRDKAEELAKRCPGYDMLRAVRYSDREIGDKENPRSLSRQFTQQLIKVNDEDVENLTRATRRWLKNQKKLWSVLAELCEWDKPANERSPLARLFSKYPQLIEHPNVKQYLRAAWERKRNKACSGKLKANGVYPYICQDPIAMIQICLEGKDPNATDLGVVPEGKVNLPKVKEGRKMACVRYPANYIVAMVVEQVNVPEFADLGNVAVLSYYGDTITRADGDFDGDEMLFLFAKHIVELLERTIAMFKPTLIDFTHSKIKCDTPFGTRDNFNEEIAKALVRAQEFNLVGRYSNLAVTCLQQASVAKDGKTCLDWLNCAKIAHVGAIVCLDMVKGAEVPEELKNQLERLYNDVRGTEEDPGFKMPWNQLFSHQELTEEDVMERTDCTQDKIAYRIFEDCGEFDIDYCGQEPIVWNDSYAFDFMPDIETRKHMKAFVVGENVVRRLRGCHAEEECGKATLDKMNDGIAVGLKEFMLFGWYNASSLMWKMPGIDGSEKRVELSKWLRKAVLDAVVNDKWIDDGREWSLTERYATMVRSIIEYAFSIGYDKNGNRVHHNHGIKEDKLGSWTMFLLRTFAEDIDMVSEAGVLTEELVSGICEKTSSAKDDAMRAFTLALQDEGLTSEELSEIMSDDYGYCDCSCGEDLYGDCTAA